MHIAPVFHYSSYIITFVIGFSQSSHKSDFRSFSYSSPIPLLCVHTSHRICANLRIESRASWRGRGSCSPL